MKINLHRNGHVYEDNGQVLTYKPGEPFKVKSKKHLEYLKHSNPVAFKELAEKTMIELVAYLVDQNGGQPVELNVVVREGAYKIGVSPETVKRYIFTHTANDAELKMVGKMVKINPFYKPENEEDE